jgi:hypothetical protein
MLRMRNLVSNRFAFLLLPVATLCAACSSSSSSGPEGGSPDSPFDAPSAEGGTDGSVPDSTVQPSNDGATDASKDASLDAALDAAPEAEAGPIVACVRGDLLCVDGGVVLCGAGGDWDGGTSTCPNGTTCSGNRCSSTLIVNAGAVSALVLDHDNFFWVNGSIPALSGVYPYPVDAGPAYIMTAPVDGGTARQIGMVVGGVGGFTAVNGTAYASQTATGQIVAIPSDGGAPGVFVDAGSNPFALATDGTNLFWCRNVAYVPLYSAPLAGGPTTSFGGVQIGIDDLAVANGTIFWGTYSGIGGIIGSAPTDGGNARALASTYDTDLWLASDGVNVYWVGWGASSGDVWQMPVGGGSPINLASNQGGPYGIAVDDASVFWTTGGSVQKVPVSGGHISTIAAAQSGAASVIVDPTYVYWGNNAAGTIERAPK